MQSRLGSVGGLHHKVGFQIAFTLHEPTTYDGCKGIPLDSLYPKGGGPLILYHNLSLSVQGLIMMGGADVVLVC